MHSELTNLLPPERRAQLAREYFLRLGVVSMICVIVLTVVASLLLVPTYVFLVKSATAKQTRLASIDSVLHSSDEATLSARLIALSNDATTLTALAALPAASDVLRDALAIPRAGISISGVTYTPAAGKTAALLILSGTAATRDALRAYQVALQNASFATAADLPVSAYAKDASIPFAITITLAL